jgi:30S ribosome assembly GTPase
MGAANVGKSSFINRLLESNYRDKSKKADRGKPSKEVPQATVSSLPGTTLDFIKIKLPNGVTMIDTPGLINRGQLTSRLTPEELRDVIPTKPINAITFRLEEGKCVMIGGLASVELVQGKPLFFTFFISNKIKLHPTTASKVAEFTAKHIGELVFPPSSIQRVEELGPYESVEFDLEGEGWKKSVHDIVIAGLGWVAITGALSTHAPDEIAPH